MNSSTPAPTPGAASELLLVPKEPTDEMLHAGMGAVVREVENGKDGHSYYPLFIYRAMVNAAPPSPATEGAQREAVAWIVWTIDECGERMQYVFNTRQEAQACADAPGSYEWTVEPLYTAPPPPDRVQPERVEAEEMCLKCGRMKPKRHNCFDDPLTPPTDASGGVTDALRSAISAIESIGRRGITALSMEGWNELLTQLRAALEAADRARKPDTRRVASGEDGGTLLERMAGFIRATLSPDYDGRARAQSLLNEFDHTASPTRAQAASAGEPVAWIVSFPDLTTMTTNTPWLADEWRRDGATVLPLYAAIPQFVTISDVQVRAAMNAYNARRARVTGDQSAWIRAALEACYAAPADGRSPNDGGYREVMEADVQELFDYIERNNLNKSKRYAWLAALKDAHAVIRCPAGEKS